MRSIAGDTARGVALAGKAGVGKSRLAREAVAAAAAAGWTVRDIAATATSRSVALGAFWQWTDGTETAPFALVRKVIETLTDDPQPDRLVVLVDDAHLLDELSALVLHQLVHSRAAAVIVTIRTGEPAPAAVTALWKDGLLRRRELEPGVTAVRAGRTVAAEPPGAGTPAGCPGVPGCLASAAPAAPAAAVITPATAAPTVTAALTGRDAPLLGAILVGRPPRSSRAGPCRASTASQGMAERSASRSKRPLRRGLRSPQQVFGTYVNPFEGELRICQVEAPLKSPIPALIALTLAPVTSQPHDTHWRRPGESPESNPGRPVSASVVDPEDDLTPVGYPGEFGTTTVIPPYTGDPAGPGGSGYNLIDHQEPLPYVQPQQPRRRPLGTQRNPSRSIRTATTTGCAPSAGAGPNIWVC